MGEGLGRVVRDVADRVLFGSATDPTKVYGGIVGAGVYVVEKVGDAVRFFGDVRSFGRNFR